jgi:hypothetical protein
MELLMKLGLIGFYLKKFNLFLFIINQKNKLLYILKIYINNILFI